MRSTGRIRTKGRKCKCSVCLKMFRWRDVHWVGLSGGVTKWKCNKCF